LLVSKLGNFGFFVLQPLPRRSLLWSAGIVSIQPDAGAAGKNRISKAAGFCGLKAETQLQGKNSAELGSLRRKLSFA
jgi:hypothetical protein